MKIKITKPGTLSTIQDAGRSFYLDQAVPMGGPMDPISAKIANIALGNSPESAVIEFTYGEAGFKAETDLLIAYSGGGSILKAGGKYLPEGRPIFIPEGFQVDIRPQKGGARVYLAVAGSWDVPEVLGSKTTYLPAAFGGLEGRMLKAGDTLISEKNISKTAFMLFETFKGPEISYPGWSIPTHLHLTGRDNQVKIFLGRESAWFEDKSIEELFSLPYRISNESNRMGFRLKGKPLQRKSIQELLSSAVLPGTIQVTGEGELVILMADCQTTGGYPKIGQVSAFDLGKCGQLKTGDEIFFKEITRRDAERDYLQTEKAIEKLILNLDRKLGKNFYNSFNDRPEL